MTIAGAQAGSDGLSSSAGGTSSSAGGLSSAAGGLSSAAGGVSSTTQPTEPFDAVAMYQAAIEAGLEAALWMRPSEGFSLVAIGRAWAVEPAGSGRFAESAARMREVLGAADAANGRGADEGLGRGVGPVLIGGLGFSGRQPPAAGEWSEFGAASLVLPAVTATQTTSGHWVTVCHSAGGAAEAAVQSWPTLLRRAAELAAGQAPDGAPEAILAIEAETPDIARWRHAVGLAAGAVGRGRIDKVVLARRQGLIANMPPDVPAALRCLAATAPESTVFAFRRGEATFMGATPERLVRTEGRAYRTAAIAGSARRGANPWEDEALAEELMASDKEREEHAVVVRTIRRQLAPISERIDVAAAPEVLRLRHVQHLATEISGVVLHDDGLLALAELLHPTPAVGGEPRDIAVQMIDEIEGFDRGWYAGPIGWLSPNGDGELMVALRCGLVRGDRVVLFAGCGIVADSDPDREWEESTIKMRTLAVALGRREEEL